MIQATFLTLLPTNHPRTPLQAVTTMYLLSETVHRERVCRFASHRSYNIVWGIDYAECPECGGEIQGWRRVS